MTDFLDSINPAVVWIIAGIVMLLMEFAAPGFIIFFFGIAALLVGFLCLILPLSLNLQLFFFILLSLFMVFFLRKKMKSIFAGRIKSANEIDDSTDSFVGEKAVVTSRITPDRGGEIELHGTSWNAEADETIEVEQLVIVIDKQNLTLKVKSLS